MATATESDTKPKFSDTFLAAYKGKETCPCCDKKLLYTNDSEKFDDIMHYTCLGCGYTFDEDESARKQRKEKKKKKNNQNPWDMGLLVLLTMLAVTLAIQTDRNRVSVADSQPVNSQPANLQPASVPPTGITTVN